MRKKTLFILCMTLCSVSVWGCGNSKEQQIADNLQEEWGIEEDEAKELAAEFAEIQEEMQEDETYDSVMSKEESTIETEEKVELQYAEPTQEILDANFEDFKFQVDTKVFHFDYDMNVEEFVNQFSDTDIVFKMDDSELNLDRLVSGEKFSSEKIDAYLNDEKCFTVSGHNYDLQGNTVSLRECPVTQLSFEQNFSGAIYFAKGIPYNNTELLQQNENLTFSNLADYLQSIGVEESTGLQSEKTFYYTQNGGMEYIITPVALYALPTRDMNMMNDKQRRYAYCSYILKLRIDPDTAKCNEVEFHTESQTQYEDDREQVPEE